MPAHLPSLTPTLVPTPVPTRIPADCADDDACLQAKPDWGAGYTCADSTDYCDSYREDMACCKRSCKACTLVPTLAPTSSTTFPTFVPTNAFQFNSSTPTITPTLFPTQNPWVVGSKGENACPAGSARIDLAVDCKAAALNGGWTWKGNETWDLAPKGCYVNSKLVYLNQHDVGSAHRNAALLCKRPPRFSTAGPTDRSQFNSSTPTLTPTQRPTQMPETLTPTKVPTLLPAVLPTLQSAPITELLKRCNSMMNTTFNEADVQLVDFSGTGVGQRS